MINLRHRGPAFFIPLSILVLSSLAIALEVPVLRGRVNDYADLMPGRVQSMEQRLEQFENDTGHQIAVLTIPSLQGEDIEGFSIRVLEKWKIGKKGFDNGVILVIAKDDRKLRIEVGYGLEGVLPDAIASRIINEVIVPRFRDGDFHGGIEAGADAIMKVTRGESLPRRSAMTIQRIAIRPAEILGLLLFASMAVFIVGLTQPSSFHGAFAGAAAGAFAAFFAWLGAGLAIAVIVLLVCSALGAYASHYARYNWGRAWTAGRSPRREPWVGNTFVGGYSDGGSGGGGGGGGFGGGGGGGGGGGASGGW